MLWDARKFRFSLPLLLLAALMLFASCGKDPAKPPIDPRPAPGREYFPLDLGTTWVYSDGDQYQEIYEVTDIQRTREDEIVTVTVTKNGIVSHQELMHWIGDKLYLTNADNGSDVAPLLVLELPLAVDAEWTKANHSSGDSFDEIRTHVLSMDSTIDVYAGTYETAFLQDIHTQRILNEDERVDTINFAYAPHVGIVLRGYGDDTLQLLAFTPGDTSAAGE